MLVTMKRQIFDSLDPAALGQACIEPILRPLHGINPDAKAQLSTQLTPGQRAQFMFVALYNHVGEAAGDLYCWVSYLLRKEPKTWLATRAAARYFGDDAMLQLLEEIEGLLEARHQQGDTEERDALPWDLDEDPEFFASMNQLNVRFHEIAPTTLRLIGLYIRNNPSDFVVIED